MSGLFLVSFPERRRRLQQSRTLIDRIDQFIGQATILEYKRRTTASISNVQQRAIGLIASPMQPIAPISGISVAESPVINADGSAWTTIRFEIRMWVTCSGCRDNNRARY